MKIRILFIALLAVLMTACGVLPDLDERETVASVAFADLIARPADYQGQFLCTSGIRLVAFEVNALAAKIDEMRESLLQRDQQPWRPTPSYATAITTWASPASGWTAPSPTS